MNNAWTHRTLFAACIFSMIVFATNFALFISQLQDWSIVWNPPTVSKMILSVFVPALVSLATGLGLNIPKMFQQNGDVK